MSVGSLHLAPLLAESSASFSFTLVHHSAALHGGSLLRRSSLHPSPAKGMDRDELEKAHGNSEAVTVFDHQVPQGTAIHKKCGSSARA